MENNTLKTSPADEKSSGPADQPEFSSRFGISLEEMYGRGVHLGHRISRLHPKMKPYVFGIKNTIHVIDLEKTAEGLEKVIEYLAGLKEKNPLILFVATPPQHKSILVRVLEGSGMPHVTNRWLGGTLTNFSMISKRIQHLKDLEAKRASGELEKYTKKERLDIDEEIRDLNEKFEGFKNLDRLPDAVFVVDPGKDALAVKEAKERGVVTIGIADTNIDPGLLDYAIPANNDAASSVEYILTKVVEALK